MSVEMYSTILWSEMIVSLSTLRHIYASHVVLPAELAFVAAKDRSPLRANCSTMIDNAKVPNCGALLRCAFAVRTSSPTLKSSVSIETDICKIDRRFESRNELAVEFGELRNNEPTWASTPTYMLSQMSVTSTIALFHPCLILDTNR